MYLVRIFDRRHALLSPTDVGKIRDLEIFCLNKRWSHLPSGRHTANNVGLCVSI